MPLFRRNFCSATDSTPNTALSTPKRPRHAVPSTASSMIPNKSSSAKLADTSFELTGVILTTLQNVSQFTGVPYLHDAASAALGILGMVATAKGNKEAFQLLANDACGLVYAVLCRTKQEKADMPGEMPPELLDSLQDLLAELTTIQKFTQKEVNRNWLSRILKNQSDLDQIMRFRMHLQQSLNVFGLKSDISIQRNIDSVLQLLKEEKMYREKEKEDRLKSEEDERKRQLDDGRPEGIEDHRIEEDRKPKEPVPALGKRQREGVGGDRNTSRVRRNSSEASDRENVNHLNDSRSTPLPSQSRASPITTNSNNASFGDFAKFNGSGAVNGNVVFTTIGGDKIDSDNSVITHNNNSGNVWNNTNSHNNNSNVWNNTNSGNVRGNYNPYSGNSFNGVDVGNTMNNMNGAYDEYGNRIYGRRKRGNRA